MRKLFAEKLHNEMAVNENIYLLTGDLGYGLWDRIKIDYPDRFINFLSGCIRKVSVPMGLLICVCSSICLIILQPTVIWIKAK